MKDKNSLLMEPPPTRGIPCILISYHRAALEREEYALVLRLITDLQSVGIKVMVDKLQEREIPPWAQLHIYDWIVLVQTKDAPNSTFVKERMMRALHQDERQHPGILSVYVSVAGTLRIPSDADGITLNASIDYARAFAGIALTIYPEYRTRLYGVGHDTANTNSVVSSPFAALSPRSRLIARRFQPFSLMFITLIITLLLGVIVTHSFASSTVKTTARKHSINTPTVIAKALTPQTLYAQTTSRTPIINDSLQRPSANQWDTTRQGGVACTFKYHSYHVSILPPSQGSRRNACLLRGPAFTNFAMQVDMKLLKGDVGGMVYHTNGQDAYSWFTLDARGCYRLVHVSLNGQISILSKDQQSCLAIPMQNTNQLTVIAQGSTIYLYINGKFIAQTIDSSIPKGGIGLIAIERAQPTEIVFHNLKVWQ
jgi:hypothetical protein